MIPLPPTPTLFPYTTLFRSYPRALGEHPAEHEQAGGHRANSVAQRIGHVIIRAVDFSRSEEHTSELQSRRDLVCRLLLEKKKLTARPPRNHNTCQLLMDN